LHENNPDLSTVTFLFDKTGKEEEEEKIYIYESGTQVFTFVLANFFLFSFSVRIIMKV
jgi:hypothetical protein